MLDDKGRDEIQKAGLGIVTEHEARQFAVLEHWQRQHGVAHLERHGEAANQEGGVVDGIAGDFGRCEFSGGGLELAVGFQLQHGKGVPDASAFEPDARLPLEEGGGVGL